MIKIYKKGENLVIGNEEFGTLSEFKRIWSDDGLKMGIISKTNEIRPVEKQVISEFKKENGDSYSTFDELNLIIDSFFVNAQLQHVGLDLVAPFVTTNLEVAEQWYNIEGSFAVTPTPNGFEVIGGILTYKGINNTSHHFAGSSDVKVSKNSILTYGLFINNETEPRGISVHTFSNPNAYELMAITKYIELNYNDEIKIKAKSNTVNTVMTPASLNTTLTGVK